MQNMWEAGATPYPTAVRLASCTSHIKMPKGIPNGRSTRGQSSHSLGPSLSVHHHHRACCRGRKMRQRCSLVSRFTADGGRRGGQPQSVLKFWGTLPSGTRTQSVRFATCLRQHLDGATKIPCICLWEIPMWFLPPRVRAIRYIRSLHI